MLTDEIDQIDEIDQKLSMLTMMFTKVLTSYSIRLDSRRQMRQIRFNHVHDAVMMFTDRACVEDKPVYCMLHVTKTLSSILT